MTQRRALDLFPWNLIEQEQPPSAPHYDSLWQAPDDCDQAFTNRTNNMIYMDWRVVRHYDTRSLMHRIIGKI
jgi:hypothetical protein